MAANLIPSGSELGQRFTHQQLEMLWVSAGGERAKANLMAAIAEAESSGYAGNSNSSGAQGLWQIKGVPFPGNPFEPLTNAKMAVAKFKSQGLGAWETYTNGSYKKFLSSSGGGGENFLEEAAKGVASPFESAGSAIGGAASSAGSVAGFLGKLGEAKTWLRVGEALGGLFLFYLGLESLTRTNAGEAAVGQARATGRATGGVAHAARKVAKVAR